MVVIVGATSLSRHTSIMQNCSWNRGCCLAARFRRLLIMIGAKNLISIICHQLWFEKLLIVMSLNINQTVCVLYFNCLYWTKLCCLFSLMKYWVMRLIVAIVKRLWFISILKIIKILIFAFSWLDWSVLWRLIVKINTLQMSTCDWFWRLLVGGICREVCVGARFLEIVGRFQYLFLSAIVREVFGGTADQSSLGDFLHFKNLNYLNL